MSKFRLIVDGINDGLPIPETFATSVPDGTGAVMAGRNVRPALTWLDAPAGTHSFAIEVVDRDVPADFADANKPDRTIPFDAPRTSFYHWLVANIPPDVTRINEAAMPEGQIGRNSFGERAKGKGGYDGPSPPWNDERVHRYHYIVYALDCGGLSLRGGFGGKDLEVAIKGHVLGTAQVIGTYTTNSRLLAQTH